VAVSRYRPRGGWRVDAFLLGGFVLITMLVWLDRFDYWDLVLRDWVDENRHSRPLYLVGRALNYLGSANLLVVIALMLATVLAGRTRSARPFLPVIAAYGISHLLLGPVKILTHRAAPHSPLADGSGFFTDPDGWSYPSGHVVNALIWYPVLLLLLDALLAVPPGPRAMVRIAAVVTVSATVTYLGYHWMTDVIGALLIGAVLDRALRRVPWLAPAPLVPQLTQPAGPSGGR
jgi:membrane-associated phospholipid phosphatase